MLGRDALWSASLSYHLKAVLSAAPLLKREWNKKERLALQDSVRTAVPDHRAAACLRHRLGSSAVAVSKTEGGQTRLSGLMVCNASHVCPICHHNKMARDRTLVAQIVAKHYDAAGFMVDAVLTVPHSAGESLAVVLERLEAVWNSLRSKKIWRELSEALGIVGCIRKLEVSLTKNGWHPHYHVSFLCDWQGALGIKGCTRHAALADVFGIVAGCWSDAGKREGIRVCMYAQAAVAIVAAVDAEKAVRYNTKNMGYGEGKGDSLTPMDLLRIIDQIDDPEAVNAAKSLFAEYAGSIKGRHVISPLGTARTTKASIAADQAAEPPKREDSDRLGTIAVEGWSAVVKARLREKVAEVTTQEDLTALILLAAWKAGYSFIPAGWLTLPPAIKTVIKVKRDPADASALEGMPT